MDFARPAHVDALLERARALLDAHVVPLEGRLMEEGFAAVLPELEHARAQVRAAGLWAPALPVEAGGMGLPLGEFAHLSELLGTTPLGHYAFNVQAPDIGNMEILHHFGSREQKERWLLPLVAGDIRSCFSMTEPQLAGSNPVMMDTTAVKDGDDYVINGRKWFTSSADGAAFAICMAVTNPEAASPHLRASQIIVPLDTPGFRFVRNISVMGDVGEGWMSHAEVAYEDCRVPRANLLGGEGAGFAIAQARLGPGRIHHTMRWIGIAERALDLMCRRALEREIAPGRPLATRQTVQNWIAESRTAIHAARLMVLHAAWKIDAVGPKAARDEVSMIKFYVAGVLQTVLDQAIQVHGALGVTDDTLLSFWFRHERAARIYDGPDEVHKAVIARRTLERYGVRMPR
ncbi:MAG: acyl-CoA dehydrogenase [Deltaproteobacteria bacterium HGW-Deltaproteobacteria-14]|jgi:alkylation response protein AidB-like acyl-CoA dehydrogenase|nr:MAG: acyl-CoA dehydrogenase [Deltaproteobacteria bacterium HGW-Deltaproteobacteria-14]